MNKDILYDVAIAEKQLPKHANDTNGQFILILYNDNVNTARYVLRTLIEICKLNPVQAEQCMVLAHLKGKTDILRSRKELLFEVQKQLSERGLTVSVENLVITE